MLKYQLNMAKAEAIYTPQVRAMYQNNPWIEALPDNPDDKELFKILKGKIPYDAVERELPAYERRECVQSLSQVFVPWGKSGEIARKIYSAIRAGYVTRNPIEQAWMQEMSELQNCVNQKDAGFRSVAGTNANACGFCIVGDSGMGKTSAVNHALAMFPQIIIHSQYHDKEFHCAQLVWMRLECPQDASVKGLCSEFFMEFDRLLGDNTFAKFASGGRTTLDQMIPRMALMAQRHGLGLLVIDEIQNLSAAKSGGAQRMLNFIVQLVNKIGIPILLVGTPHAIDLLSPDFMSIRRSTGQQGACMLDALEPKSNDWNNFTKGIWRYQWTADKTELSAELQDVLNELSYGNIDAAVKLYMEAQRLAITLGQVGKSEIITTETLKQAAAGDSFRLVLRQLAIEYERKNKDGKQAVLTQQDRREVPASRKRQTMPKQQTAGIRNHSEESMRTDEDILASLAAHGQIVTPEDEF